MSTSPSSPPPSAGYNNTYNSGYPFPPGAAQQQQPSQQQEPQYAPSNQQHRHSYTPSSNSHSHSNSSPSYIGTATPANGSTTGGATAGIAGGADNTNRSSMYKPPLSSPNSKNGNLTGFNGYHVDPGNSNNNSNIALAGVGSTLPVLPNSPSSNSPAYATYCNQSNGNGNGNTSPTQSPTRTGTGTGTNLLFSPSISLNGNNTKEKLAQRRLSSFKHSDQDYYNNPTIRAAYLSPVSHALSIWIPFIGFIAILGGMWGLTIATQVSKDHMIEVRSEHFYNFAIDWPTVLVAAYTFISSILNSILLWCFGCAVLSYARYRLSLGKPISLRGLSALTSAKDGQFALHPLGSRWFWLCMFCWSAFLATTAGFNTIILPTRRVVNQDIQAIELDMTTPSFADFCNSNLDTYYDCSRWTSIRGLMVSPCPAGTAFTATTYAGRAQYESAELKELTYIRLGSITFTGATWGTFPYTTFNAKDSNAFQSAGELKRFPGARQNFSISLETQGLRATITCADVATSPLSMDTSSTTPLACNTRTPVATINPTLRMRAGYCLSNSNGDMWDGHLYEFYMRFAGEYIHIDSSTGTSIPHNENITCTIQPFVTTEWAQFHSFDNSTWVTQRQAFNADQKQYPQAVVERILDNLVNMMVIFGQNSVDNLLAEQFVQITTSYTNGAYQSWPRVAQRQMEGMFAYLASTERVLAESMTAASPAMDRVTVNGTLSHDTFAYAVDYPSYLLLIPITIACFLGMFLLIKSASFRHVPRFDPLSVTSLAVASSATGHSLYLDESALKGASPDDEGANDAHVAFVRDEQTGQWGLQRVPI